MSSSTDMTEVSSTNGAPTMPTNSNSDSNSNSNSNSNNTMHDGDGDGDDEFVQTVQRELRPRKSTNEDEESEFEDDGQSDDEDEDESGRRRSRAGAAPGIPRVLVNWTPEEDAALLDGYERFQGRWTLIVRDAELGARLAGHTPEQLRNRWRNVGRSEEAIARFGVTVKGRSKYSSEEYEPAHEPAVTHTHTHTHTHTNTSNVSNHPLSTGKLPANPAFPFTLGTLQPDIWLGRKYPTHIYDERANPFKEEKMLDSNEKKRRKLNDENDDSNVVDETDQYLNDPLFPYFYEHRHDSVRLHDGNNLNVPINVLKNFFEKNIGLPQQKAMQLVKSLHEQRDHASRHYQLSVNLYAELSSKDLNYELSTLNAFSSIKELHNRQIATFIESRKQAAVNLFNKFFQYRSQKEISHLKQLEVQYDNAIQKIQSQFNAKQNVTNDKPATTSTPYVHPDATRRSSRRMGGVPDNETPSANPIKEEKEKEKEKEKADEEGHTSKDATAPVKAEEAEGVEPPKPVFEEEEPEDPAVTVEYCDPPLRIVLSKSTHRFIRYKYVPEDNHPEEEVVSSDPEDYTGLTLPIVLKRESKNPPRYTHITFAQHAATKFLAVQKKAAATKRQPK